MNKLIFIFIIVCLSIINTQECSYQLFSIDPNCIAPAPNPPYVCHYVLRVIIDKPCFVSIINSVGTFYESFNLTSFQQFSTTFKERMKMMTTTMVLAAHQPVCAYDDLISGNNNDFFDTNGNSSYSYQTTKIEERYLLDTNPLVKAAGYSSYKIGVDVFRDIAMSNDDTIQFETLQSSESSVYRPFTQSFIDGLIYNIQNNAAIGDFQFSSYDDGGATGFYPYFSSIVPCQNSPDFSCIQSSICSIDNVDSSNLYTNTWLDCNTGLINVINTNYSPSLIVDSSICNTLRNGGSSTVNDIATIDFSVILNSAQPPTSIQSLTILANVPQAFTLNMYPEDNNCIIVLTLPTILPYNTMRCGYYKDNNPINFNLIFINIAAVYDKPIFVYGASCSSLTWTCSGGQTINAILNPPSSLSIQSITTQIGNDPSITFWDSVAQYFSVIYSIVSWLFFPFLLIFWVLIIWLIWWLISLCCMNCKCCEDCCLPCRYGWYEHRCKLEKWEKEGYEKEQQKRSGMSGYSEQEMKEFMRFQEMKKNVNVPTTTTTITSVNVPYTEGL